VLSALGIMIGITAMMAVVGIASSSQARLERQLAALGTNLLTAQAGTDPTGQPADLPTDSIVRTERMPGSESVASVAALAQNVYRNRHVDPSATSGITVMAADLELPEVLGIGMRQGRWLDEASSRFPVVVLGEGAAERLGIPGPGTQVQIGDQLFTVGGIIERSPLAEELDYAALIGEEVARTSFGDDGHPTRLYVRATTSDVVGTRARLAPTLDPQDPSLVQVSRPSDALAAQQAADDTFTGLLLALGGIALLVGGIGVANTMIISVYERRSEIGLRRSLGATRSHIRQQFVAEAMVLSLLGGVAGVLAGVGITAVAAANNGWPLAMEPRTPALALICTLFVGMVAGVYPAARAARTSPTEALSS
jgi:putative ABC transport system permease protein